MQKLDLDIRLFLSRHSVEGRLGVDLSSVLFLTYLAGWGGGGDGWTGGSTGKNKGTSIKSDAEIRRSIFLTWLRSVASHLSGGIETLLRKSFFPLDWHTHASI